MSHAIIPHSRPTLGDEEARAVAEVVRSGHISRGDRVREFEERLSAFFGVEGAVAVNSGTSALHLGMSAMGISGGDEVLFPSYVCTAPLNAVYIRGAEPVVCDVDPDSYNISAEDISDRRTGRAVAVMVPHMFGAVADIEEIEKFGLPVIEDCAHAAGALYGGKKAGGLGRFSMLSFYANKMIACGEGGAVLSDDKALLEEVRDISDYDHKQDHKPRYSCKMTDLQAAVGIVQLGRLPGMIERRKELAERYDIELGGLDVALPRVEFDHVYYRYVIRIKSDVDVFIRSMLGRGVLCARPVFKPVHRYLELRSGYTNTDEVYSSAVSLPVYPSLADEEQDRVITAVKRCVAGQ